MLARYSASPVTVGEPAPRLYVLSLFSNSPPCIIRLKLDIKPVLSSIQWTPLYKLSLFAYIPGFAQNIRFPGSSLSAGVARVLQSAVRASDRRRRLPIERELATLHIAKWARLGLWSARPRTRLATPRNSTELSFVLTNKPAGLDFVLWASLLLLYFPYAGKQKTRHFV